MNRCDGKETSRPLPSCLKYQNPINYDSSSGEGQLPGDVTSQAELELSHLNTRANRLLESLLEQAEPCARKLASQAEESAGSGFDLLGLKEAGTGVSSSELGARAPARRPAQTRCRDSQKEPHEASPSPLPANTYFAQDLPAGRPAQPLGQAVEEPEPGEGGDGGAPGEDHVDQAHHQEAGGEEPAGAQLVGEDAADELADGVRGGLAAGDETCGGAEPETRLSRAARPPARPLTPAPGGQGGGGAAGTGTHPARPSPAAPRP